VSKLCVKDGFVTNDRLQHLLDVEAIARVRLERLCIDSPS
jgi:hypothetical protein